MNVLCRTFGHWPKLHRTPAGAAFVTCHVCGRRLAHWRSGLVRSMRPGELDALVKRTRRALGGTVDVHALREGRKR